MNEKITERLNTILAIAPEGMKSVMSTHLSALVRELQEEITDYPCGYYRDQSHQWRINHAVPVLDLIPPVYFFECECGATRSGTK